MYVIKRNVTNNINFVSMLKTTNIVLKTNNCSSENTYNVWYLKPYQSIYIVQSIIDNWISIMPYKYDKNKRNHAMTYTFRNQSHVHKTCRGWDINKYAVIISRIYRILRHHIDPHIHQIYDTYNLKNIVSINNYNIIDYLVISSIFGSTIWFTIM